MEFYHLFISSYGPGFRTSSFLLSLWQRPSHVHIFVPTPDFWLLTSAVRSSFLLHASLGLSDRADTLTSFACFECNTTPDPKLIPLPTVPFAYNNGRQKADVDIWESRIAVPNNPSSYHITVALWVAFLNSARLYMLQHYYHLHLAFLNSANLYTLQHYHQWLLKMLVEDVRAFVSMTI